MFKSNINDVKNVSKNEYKNLYYKLKTQVDSYFKNNRLDEKSYSICIHILNDIFHYYRDGYPNIPDEYLYHEEN